MPKKFAAFALCFLFFLNVGFTKPKVIDSTLAVINSRVITLGEIQKAIEPMRLKLAQKYRGQELNKKLSELFIQELVRRKNAILLEDEAERSLRPGIKQHVNSLVEKDVKNRAANAGSMTNFLRKLKEEKIELEDFKKEIRTRKLIDFLLYENIYSKIRVTPDHVREEYEKTRNQYAKKESATVQHIFITADREDSLDAARKAHRELKLGVAFAELARKWSDGPKAQEGGLWESVERGTLVTEVDKVIFSLAQNSLSPIIKSSVGYHIVRVIELTAPRILSFEEVQSEIRINLRKRIGIKLRQDYIKEIEGRSYVRMRMQPPKEK